MSISSSYVLTFYTSYSLPLSVPLEAPDLYHTETYLNKTLYIEVEWRGIPEDRVDGTLTGYKVFYRPAGNREYLVKEVGPEVYKTIIDIDNKPEEYEIRVAGFTRGGDGPMTWPRFRTGIKLILSFIPCRRTYSQRECRKAVFYSSVVHLTFQSCAALIPCEDPCMCLL